MALDVLILGPFEFTDFAVPERMALGGKQQLIIHKMPGGDRAIDAMGSDDDDRRWSGILWGEDAEAKALTLDAMRRQGTELPFSWGAESRTAVIFDFKAQFEKFNCVHYDITVVLSDNQAGGGGGGETPSFDSMIGGDLSAASNISAGNVAGLSPADALAQGIAPL